jgi:hypothetical protein
VVNIIIAVFVRPLFMAIDALQRERLISYILPRNNLFGKLVLNQRFLAPPIIYANDIDEKINFMQKASTTRYACVLASRGEKMNVFKPMRVKINASLFRNFFDNFSTDTTTNEKPSRIIVQHLNKIFKLRSMPVRLMLS